MASRNADGRYTKRERHLAWILIILCICLVFTSFSFSICPGKHFQKDQKLHEVTTETVYNVALKNLGAVSLKTGNYYAFICNAYRVKKSWFLTTSKCVKLSKMSSNAVVRTNISWWNAKSTDFEIMEHHTLDNEDDNIGLLKVNYVRLGRSAQFSESQIFDYELRGMNFWTFGWAIKSDPSKECVVVSKMKEIRHEVCRKSCNNNIICLLPVEHNDTCLPDEGAGLIYLNSFYGIKSRGESCGLDQVQVYVKIGSYTDWILKTAVF